MKHDSKAEQKLGIQLKFIHVIRNLFDNIATMTLRRAEEKKKGQENLKVKSKVYRTVIHQTIPLV